MPLRPTQSNWLETFVPREKVVYAVEALAATNLVQLELDPRHTVALHAEPVKRTLLAFDHIIHQYADYLPAENEFPAFRGEAPDKAASQALLVIQEWASVLAELLEKQKLLRKTQENLLLLEECLLSLAGGSDILAPLAHHTAFLYKGIFSCAKDCCPENEIGAAVSQISRGEKHDFLLVADNSEREPAIRAFFQERGCNHLNIPAWVSGDAEEQRTQLSRHRQKVTGELDQIDSAIHSCRFDEETAQALTNMAMLGWYVTHSLKQDYDQKYCHLSGWAATDDLHYLQSTLEKARIPAVIRFAQPPPSAKPPVVLSRYWWTRPFRIFMEMSGTPGRMEIDPSPLLPFIVPLLFGYMFPDVGHGLMLVLLGSTLYKRWPDGRFLIPCGLSASLFGLVFGEIFGIHGLWPPLWLHPLENPYEVLIPPLVFGAALILLGLVFNGIEAHWEERFKSWMLSDAAVLTLYLIVLTGIFYPSLFWLLPVPLLWYLAGSIYLAGGPLTRSLGRALGNLLESSLLLGLNTFSFLRVGAFALAHAGLSFALLTLASHVEHPWWHVLTLVLGHIFLVGLEGLVVFVQATRLVLFEFLIRFLRAEGRIFQPIERRPPQH